MLLNKRPHNHFLRSNVLSHDSEAVPMCYALYVAQPYPNNPNAVADYGAYDVCDVPLLIVIWFNHNDEVSKNI